MTIGNGFGQAIYGNSIVPKSAQKTVTTAGTRVQLSTTSAKVNGVIVKALAANTGVVFVGDVTVTNAGGAAAGFQLSAKESVILFTGNITNIYIDAATNGEGVCYIVF